MKRTGFKNKCQGCGDMADSTETFWIKGLGMVHVDYNCARKALPSHVANDTVQYAVDGAIARWKAAFPDWPPTDD